MNEFPGQTRLSFSLRTIKSYERPYSFARFLNPSSLGDDEFWRVEWEKFEISALTLKDGNIRAIKRR